MGNKIGRPPADWVINLDARNILSGLESEFTTVDFMLFTHPHTKGKKFKEVQDVYEKCRKFLRSKKLKRKREYEDNGIIYKCLYSRKQLMQVLFGG